MNRLVLVDEDDDVYETEGKSGRVLKKRRRQEAPTPLVNIEYSEGTQSIELSEF